MYQQKKSFILSPLWGCLWMLFHCPEASPLAISFLPFGHDGAHHLWRQQTFRISATDFLANW